MVDVIGAGFGRTGTHSLAAALEILGFGPCYHMHELSRNPEHIPIWFDALKRENVDWQGLFEPYKSTVEWPAASFLPQLLSAFPDSKVVLTLRDPYDWYASAADTIFEALEMSRFNPHPHQQEQASFARRLILEGVFSNRHQDKEFAMGIFEQHSDKVIKLVPKDRLLLYRITEGWGSLCAFLGTEPPDISFPWLNEKTEFIASEPEWAKEVKKKRAAEKISNDPN